MVDINGRVALRISALLFSFYIFTTPAFAADCTGLHRSWVRVRAENFNFLMSMSCSASDLEKYKQALDRRREIAEAFYAGNCHRTAKQYDSSNMIPVNPSGWLEEDRARITKRTAHCKEHKELDRRADIEKRLTDDLDFKQRSDFYKRLSEAKIDMFKSPDQATAIREQVLRRVPAEKTHLAGEDSPPKKSNSNVGSEAASTNPRNCIAEVKRTSNTHRSVTLKNTCRDNVMVHYNTGKITTRIALSPQETGDMVGAGELREAVWPEITKVCWGNRPGCS